MFGICNLSLVPVRAEASDKSEMVNQLLFGETFEVIGTKQQWKKVRLHYDDYEGWIDEKQFKELTNEQYQALQSTPIFVNLDLLQIILFQNSMMPLVLGCNLPFFANKTCKIGTDEYQYDGHVSDVSVPDSNKHLLVENANKYMNAPYLWGGRSPFGIDCSGLTQIVYKLSGIKLKRDAYQQAEQGHTLNFLEEAEPGDLAFFDNEEGRITHVGIVLPNRQIIHAHGRVRVDSLDHHGIYNIATQKYSHKLRLIKRLI